jgi:hypothetical protein
MVSRGKFRIHRHHQIQIGTDAFGGILGTNHKPATQLTRVSSQQVHTTHDDVHYPHGQMRTVEYFMMSWGTGENKDD